MSSLFSLTVPWWELVIRAICVYLFLLIALRMSGKKQFGEFSAFDFVLLLILSDSVQNSMTAGDDSMLGGLILAGTLITFNWFMDYLSFKLKKFAALTEGTPQILIHQGKVNEKIRRIERITDEEMALILRKNNITDIKEIEYAVLEINGDVNVIKVKK